jgi:hypothetical protein
MNCGLPIADCGLDEALPGAGSPLVFQSAIRNPQSALQ